jgi:signal transduction histidine kinase
LSGIGITNAGRDIHTRSLSPITGPSEKDVDHIFDRFFRVKNEKTRYINGTGLGLAIVKSIVEAHHGTIEVESEVDKGTCFSVYFPRSAYNI